ncbi:hypothetical protein MTR_4g032480 [Medicago truncatula]|uniref:Uncharacterized protein n=1 Tax=Medicago truncatula TaxID=3880 RepID=G7JN73_MEDTR|nr:hypothetical protein MTR_4g032480 [Medicago truncatula]
MGRDVSINNPGKKPDMHQQFSLPEVSPFRCFSPVKVLPPPPQPQPLVLVLNRSMITLLFLHHRRRCHRHRLRLLEKLLILIETYLRNMNAGGGGGIQFVINDGDEPGRRDGRKNESDYTDD